MFDEIRAFLDRDPAARGVTGVLEVVLSYSGYHAIKMHRLAHFLHKLKVPLLPRLISQFSRFITGIEIHPGAQIGRRFFIDHGMGVVIGETTVIGDDCTLFQGVTLGGTGKESGKRHPNLGNNVLVGAGAKILGNITIGDNCKIGAQSLVLHDVPPNCTVVGVPGQVVRREGQKPPKADMNQIDLPDPIMDCITQIQQRLDTLVEERVRAVLADMGITPVHPRHDAD
ncbi:serine O-acetyltransferase [bacterium]|nr:serine O-acetyltransferase [bacterium]